MKGVIILPKVLEKAWTPIKNNFSKISKPAPPFYYGLKEKFGFEIRYTDKIDTDSNTDIVFIHRMPPIEALDGIHKNTKIIIWAGDIHCKGIKSRLDNLDKLFQKTDLIMATYYDMFMKLYPQYVSKYKFVPFFFAPHERYTKLRYNKKPRMICLQTGAMKVGYYPLRHFISIHAKNVIYERAIGDNFAKMLNSYFCCVNPSGIYNSPVAKCFEIPAAGCLLLTNETNDLKKVGFVANKHYVPINQDNVLQTITHCLKNPTKYEHIRKEGMEYVHKNHSINNRIEMFKTIFKELLE